MVMLLFPMAQARFPLRAQAQSIQAQSTQAQSAIETPQQLSTLVAQANSTQRLERVLSVTGTGRQSIPTSLSQVSLGVVVEAQTARQAQQQAAQRQTAVIEWLRSQNVAELETTGISLNPRYDYSENRQVLRGYEAVNTVSFEVETEAAGGVIDGAITAGATRIEGVRFTATDSVVEAARQQALELAVADAQQQADTVLSALNLSRQEIIGVVVGSINAPPPAPTARALSASVAEDVATPVVGQSQTVTTQVTLDIRY